MLGIIHRTKIRIKRYYNIEVMKNMDKFNPHISYDINGKLNTDDEALNNIIRAVEEDTGSIIAAATPAVTFDNPPDEKIYLVLLTIYPTSFVEEEIVRDWQVKVGRQETYDFLKDLVKEEAIDPNASFVIVGSDEYDEQFRKPNVNFSGKPITVFRFLKVMLDSNKVLDDKADFDINEFDPANYDHGDLTIME